MQRDRETKAVKAKKSVYRLLYLDVTGFRDSWSFIVGVNLIESQFVGRTKLLLRKYLKTKLVTFKVYIPFTTLQSSSCRDGLVHNFLRSFPSIISRSLY